MLFSILLLYLKISVNKITINLNLRIIALNSEG